MTRVKMLVLNILSICIIGLGSAFLMQNDAQATSRYLALDACKATFGAKCICEGTCKAGLFKCKCIAPSEGGEETPEKK